MKIAIIGFGQMGSAIANGILLKTDADLNLFDINKSKLEKFQNTNDRVKNARIKIYEDLNSAVVESEMIVLAVKPNDIQKVISKIKNELKNKLLISVAAGVTLATMAEVAGIDKKIIRVMPNTPCLVGEGMSVFALNENIEAEDLENADAVFASVGKVMVLDESLIDAVSAVSGSSPAFLFTAIQAMSDAAVKLGIPRGDSYLLSAQTMLGTAKMVLTTNKNPIELRNEVSTPGGSTIVGIHTLENKCFAGTLISAIEDSYNKAKGLG